jgi:hypothetical protein
MNSRNYKDAFDSVKFRDSFEQDTEEYLLRAADSKTQKENRYMNKQKVLKTSMIAAAMIVILSISAFAIWKLLLPKEVAQQAGNTALAEAFASKDAINIGESVQTGDYTITLGGIVSGKGLTDYCSDVQEDTSYIVASVAYTDGRKIAEAGETGILFTPLVSGYKPWQVNAWTLNGGNSSFIYEGVNYFIFECSNIEIFADHTVYLAAYEGNAPDSGTFIMSANGEISFAEGFSAPHALFTLPLDSSKANPDAVNKLLASNGIITG